MLRYFVSVTLPSLTIATVWMGVMGFLLTRKIRRYSAERRAVMAQRHVLRQAQDALAAVITDTLTSASDLRNQALPAYEALGRLTDSKEISS